jgi:hypothetical protein
MPKVGAGPRLTLPSEPTAIPVAIICALYQYEKLRPLKKEDLLDEFNRTEEQDLACYISPACYPTYKRGIFRRSEFRREEIQSGTRTTSVDKPLNLVT